MECIETHTFRPVDYEKNEMLLTYDSSKPGEAADDILKKYRLRAKRSDKLDSIKTTMITAATNGQDPYDVVHAIKLHETDVDAATSNFYATANIPETGPAGYPLGMTGVSTARSHTDGKGVVIGMIDTPVDMTYGDSLNASIERIDLVRPGDEQNRLHGTEVAGVLVSQNPRIGIAPEAKLLAISAFTSNPNNPGEHRSNSGLIARALEMAIREKVDVLNLSFAGKSDPIVDKLINAAMQQGIVVVASAGNGGPNAQPAYPAAIPGVVAVTAVDKGEKVFQQANRGDYIDLAAPGVSILTTAPRGSFHVSSGTSLATAHASGVIALLMSLNRQGFSPALLDKTAIDLGAPGRDPDYGYGLVSAERAIGAIGVH
jgi:subtilisin family serine protease